jgi:AAA+ ATPase superfamily predicted ATPase
MRPIPKESELSKLKEIVSSSKSEFVYVRGRRRIGKSWLLDELHQKTPKSFFFSGAKDSSAEKTKSSFLKLWAAFSDNPLLASVNSELITWSEIFVQVLNYAKQEKRPITLIFDEIQWIAKQGSGFIGELKAAWVQWQKVGLIKVIICGSSNKFFEQHVGGEEKILRGIQTRPTLWVAALSPADVHTYICPKWTLQECTLLYMLCGGVPYYYQALESEKGFIHGINDAYFVANNNLLGELEEMLDLEFNSAGKATAVKILSALGQQGRAVMQVAEISGLAKATVSRVLSTLLEYKLVAIKRSNPFKTAEEIGARYYIEDLFLNAYFQIFERLKSKIETNDTGLLFPSATQLSLDGYYIPGFTGHAFENFIRYFLAQRMQFPNQLYRSLMLKEVDYEVGDYWENGKQIDLLVMSKTDRIIRTLECKWARWDRSFIAQAAGKAFELPKNKHCTFKNYLICSEPVPATAIKEMDQFGLECIQLQHMYDVSAKRTRP